MKATDALKIIGSLPTVIESEDNLLALQSGEVIAKIVKEKLRLIVLRYPIILF